MGDSGCNCVSLSQPIEIMAPIRLTPKRFRYYEGTLLRNMLRRQLVEDKKHSSINLRMSLCRGVSNLLPPSVKNSSHINVPLLQLSLPIPGQTPQYFTIDLQFIPLTLSGPFATI